MAFTSTMADLALQHWPDLPQEKIVTITQAVVTTPSQDYSLRGKFGLSGMRLLLSFDS